MVTVFDIRSGISNKTGKPYNVLAVRDDRGYAGDVFVNKATYDRFVDVALPVNVTVSIVVSGGRVYPTFSPEV